jgi:protein ImuB
VAACWDEQEPEVTADIPVAVMHKGVVRDCSTLARQDGVRVGMKRREAQHACRNLTLVAYRPERDSAFFDRVVIALSDYVPDHALLSPGMVLFYARGLSRFYGSEEKAAQVLRRVVCTEMNSPDVRVGVADDVFSAVMAATQSY